MSPLIHFTTHTLIKVMQNLSFGGSQIEIGGGASEVWAEPPTGYRTGAEPLVRMSRGEAL